MSNDIQAKVLSPIKRKNKSGIVYLGRISRIVDGFRKNETVGTFKSKEVAIRASEDRIIQLNQFLIDDVVETKMTLLEFISKHYASWRKDRFVAPNVEQFIRFIKEFDLDVPLQKINSRYCNKYRKQIEYFKKPNGSEYDLNNIYIRLVAELSWCLRYAYDLGYIKQNFNDRLQNPYIVENNPRWKDQHESKYKQKHSWYNRAWNKKQLAEFLPLFAKLPKTQLVRRNVRPDAKARKANIRKADGADSWRVYWNDNDGNFRSKNFHWKKNGGRERALVKAEAYAEAITEELEQNDGTYISEIKTFRDIENVMWWAYMTLTLMLGLRNGEACALKFSDFDEDRSYVSITKQLAIRGDSVQEVAPKKKSYRDISYPPEVQDVLDTLKLHYQTYGNNDGDYLLQYRNGGRVRPDYWHKHYKKVQTLAGIPETEQLDGTHSGRHTHLSILAQAGVPHTMLQERAGHKDIRTTTGYYIHQENDYLASETISISNSKDDITSLK